MNMMERRAIKRAERELARHLAPGESVANFDIGTHAILGGRYDVIATDRAVYLVDPRTRGVTRLPFDEIVDATYKILGRTADLALSHVSGAFTRISFSPARHELGDVVLAGVASFEFERGLLDGPHGTIELVGRRIGGEARFVWAPAPGVSRTPELVEWAQGIVNRRAAGGAD